MATDATGSVVRVSICCSSPKCFANRPRTSWKRLDGCAAQKNGGVLDRKQRGRTEICTAYSCAGFEIPFLETAAAPPLRGSLSNSLVHLNIFISGCHQLQTGSVRTSLVRSTTAASLMVAFFEGLSEKDGGRRHDPLEKATSPRRIPRRGAEDHRQVEAKGWSVTIRTKWRDTTLPSSPTIHESGGRRL